MKTGSRILFGLDLPKIFCPGDSNCSSHIGRRLLRNVNWKQSHAVRTCVGIYMHLVMFVGCRISSSD